MRRKRTGELLLGLFLSQVYPLCRHSGLIRSGEVIKLLDNLGWLFAGSERGGDRAAFMYSLIVTAKLNEIDPQTWLADVLARMPNMPVSRLPELLPWNWRQRSARRREA